MTKQITIEIPRKAAIACACLALGGALGGAPLLFADGDPTTADVLRGMDYLPYRGYIIQDSTPLNGTVRLKAELYQSTDGNAAPLAELEHVVTVENGWFTLRITDTPRMQLHARDGEPLYLAITIMEDDGNGGFTEVPLSGRQRLEPTPHALWTGNASGLRVEGDLDVVENTIYRSDTTIEGPLSVGGELTTTQGLDVAGDLNLPNGAVVEGDTTFTQEATLTGNAEVGGLSFLTAAGRTFSLTGASPANDQYGVELIPSSNPPVGSPLFRVMSASGIERLRVTHQGGLSTIGGLTVLRNSYLGDSTADTTTINGNLTVNDDIVNVVGTKQNLESSSGGSNNSVVTSTKNGTISADRSVCFLRTIIIADHDEDDVQGCATVVNGSNEWAIETYVEGGNDTVINCAMSCIQW